MNILEDCSGIILFNNSITKGTTLSFFIINHEGFLNYSDDESYITEKLENQEQNKNHIIESFNLNEYLITTLIKPYTDDKFNNLQSRSYFELTKKETNFTVYLFAYKEENINQLFEYTKNFSSSLTLSESQPQQSKIDINQKLNELDQDNKIRQNTATTLKTINSNRIRDVKYMEELISKLDGKFVNQDDWDKESIKVINPSSNEEEYEESWIKLDNGSDYSGPVKNGYPHGYGKEFRKDGSIYTGYFYLGKWHGIGNITSINLDNYSGEFIDGCICGI